MAVFVFNLSKLDFGEEARRMRQGRDFLLAQPRVSLGLKSSVGRNYYLVSLLRSRYLYGRYPVLLNALANYNYNKLIILFIIYLYIIIISNK